MLVELLEEGSATPGGIRPRFYDLVPAVTHATLVVADTSAAAVDEKLLAVERIVNGDRKSVV